MRVISENGLLKKLDKCESLIEQGKYYQVKLILEKYPQLKSFSCKDRSLLLSCYPDNLDFLRDLIKLGLNPNITDTCNGTWLMSFASMGNIEMVDFFLRHGADVNIKTNLNETAFSFACASDQFECAKLLYAYGADINNVSGGCATPLDWIREESKEFADWVINNGGEKYSELK